jgi:hypothetical protein
MCKWKALGGSGSGGSPFQEGLRESKRNRHKTAGVSINVKPNLIQPRYHCAKLLSVKVNMLLCDKYNCNFLSLYISFPPYQILILLNLSSLEGGRTKRLLDSAHFPDPYAGLYLTVKEN